ncbi:acyltransferase family protein [Fibrella forsythiae]|uniref:Acyltransferase n=1 Tax=Fibrella forsythiae TaxID=2817061 RepID=A0ABS3JMJ5_9BACT|nr:acyltransferase [Fibrella forsythiae]MBO0951236.1 acyltransferase [Fibrella forsythiae]
MNPVTRQPHLPPQRLPGLDHLRALAIALVFFFHYQIPLFGHPDWIPAYAAFGWTGVDLFFVLSGFLVSSHLFDQLNRGQPIRWKAYATKRFFRIVPAYVLVTAVYFMVPQFREKEALPPLWKFLTFTQNLGLNLRELGTFSHAWSLCVEVHFYLLLPLLVGLVAHRRRTYWLYWAILLLFAGGFFLRQYNWTTFYLPARGTDNEYITWYQYVYYPTYNRLDGVLVGVFIAGITSFSPISWARLTPYGNWLLLFGLLALTGAYFVCEDSLSYMASMAGFPLVAIGYGLLVLSALLPSGTLYNLPSRLTSFVARISYAVYLTHKGVIHVTQALLSKLSVDTTSNMTLLLCICSCVLVATALNMLIEQPVIEWAKNRITSRPKRLAA